MFAKGPIEAKLDSEITSALRELEKHESTSEEYGTIVDRVSKLHKLKSEEVQNQIKIEETLHRFETDSKPKPPSLDTVLVVGANIFGILWITRYERTRVITTKALGIALKPRL